MSKEPTEGAPDEIEGEAVNPAQTEIVVDEDGEVVDGDPQLIEWSGDRIEFSEAMLDRGRAYGAYVNAGRALPEVRDGLKPVQRRIIFAMDLLGARADRPYRKSAKTAGAVIGDWHPHGDAAVYDAMVRMAQDFQCGLGAVMVDGQGNWGTIDGDPAAAQRYTESRLSALASEFLSDLRPEIVPFKPNFSEEKQEPVVLPVTAPMLLCMGISGIGWSLATSIPPHNLAEAIDAAILIAENPEATVTQLMRRLPGPDFPGGGIIVNPDGLAEIFATGQGTIQLQARYSIENMPGNTQGIILTELPYQIGPDQIVKQIVEAARAGKTDQFTEMPKNLSSKGSLRVQVRVKRGGSTAKALQDLFRYTDARKTIAYNMTVLVDGKPRVVSVPEALRHFVAFRHEVVTRRLEFERAQLARDLHRLQAIIAALDLIDEVIKIIRASDDDEASKAALMKKLFYVPHGAKKKQPIDEQQAQWVIETQLRRLSRMNKLSLEEEAAKKAARIDEIDAILASATGVRDIVISELRETKRRHGQPRRAQFADGTVALDAGAEAGTAGAPAAAIANRPVVAYISSAGTAIVTDPPGKAPKSAPISLGGDARLIAVRAVDTDTALICVSARGTAYRVSLADQPPENKKGKGRSLVALERGDRLVAALPVDSGDYALLVTRGGEIKRVGWDLLAAAHAGGVACMRVADDDALVAVVPHGEKCEVLLASAGGQALRIECDKIRPVATGTAGGVAGMRLAAGDHLVGASLAEGELVLVLHETGAGKFVALADYPTKGRGGGGVASSSPDKPTRQPAGAVTLTAAVMAGEVRVVSAAGQLMTLAAADPVARAVVARPLLDLGPGDAPAFVVE